MSITSPNEEGNQIFGGKISRAVPLVNIEPTAHEGSAMGANKFSSKSEGETSGVRADVQPANLRGVEEIGEEASTQSRRR